MPPPRQEPGRSARPSIDDAAVANVQLSLVDAPERDDAVRSLRLHLDDPGEDDLSIGVGRDDDLRERGVGLRNCRVPVGKREAPYDRPLAGKTHRQWIVHGEGPCDLTDGRTGRATGE